MKTHKDVAMEGSSYLIGLTKIVDKGIKEVVWYLSTEYDDPVFELSQIIFDDGSILGCEGEHDFPYLVTYGKSTPKNYNDEILSNIYKTDPDNQEENED